MPFNKEFRAKLDEYFGHFCTVVNFENWKINLKNLLD